MQIFFHIVSVFANQTCASKETFLEFCAPLASAAPAQQCAVAIDSTFRDVT